LEQISDELSAEVTVAKVNIDDNPNAPSKYGVRGIPTLLIFRGGELVDRKVGADSKTGISNWIRSAL
ncbi:MAG: thioredoxin domain-containing protein, partial [Pseudomonadota bacterium]